MKSVYLRLLVVILGLGFFTYGATPSEDWLPVTTQDLQIKEVPGTPNAPAIQLYYAHYIYVDQNEEAQFFYCRIKLLTDAGRQYADVEIPVFPGVKLTDLQARTIRPDGSIVTFTGSPFEKTLIKGRGFKLLAQTLTLPEAGVGSIIEYKYKLKAWAFRSNHWDVQHNLFTVREHFRYLSPSTFVPVTYVVSKSIPKQPSKDKNNFDLELENVPAFEAEEQMPPEEIYKQVVYFFTGYMGLPDFFWATKMRVMATDFEEFIGDHKEIRAAAEETTRGVTDSQEKLRKLYARAQQIRNLGYERERTESERKKEDLKPSKDVVDVLKHGYGFHNGISAFFVAMARAQGFQADIVVAASRKERFFQKGLLDGSQLDSVLTVVQVDHKDLYLDPGTRFCPYGTLRWTIAGTTAAKLYKGGGSFIVVPGSGADKAMTWRTAHLTLAEDGSVKGNVIVKFEGGEALEHRLATVSTDEAGRNHDMEEEMKRWLPPNATVKAISSQGWDQQDAPLIANFDIEVPAYASIAGKRILVTDYLFQTRQKEAFKHSVRKYPVYFPYAFVEWDEITITLPPGYVLESSPERQQIATDVGNYRRVSEVTGNQINMKRMLLLSGALFDVKIYDQLRAFFATVQAGDEAQTVLQRTDSKAAVKPN
jgi:hypothetical protein